MRLVLAVLLIMLALQASLVDARRRRRRYDGRLRIVSSGADPYRGRLEIQWRRRWGTVCNDYFTHTSADIACREMGLNGGWRVGRYNQNGLCRNVDGRNMCGRGRIWLDDVRCRNRDKRIKNCRHLPFGWHDCRHHEDIIIQCRPPRYGSTNGGSANVDDNGNPPPNAPPPPIWGIEWTKVDQPDVRGYYSGVVANYVLFLKRTVTPNMFTRCWPEWKANQKVRIMIYTDDTMEKENPAHLGKTIMNWSWVVGWIQPPYYLPYVYFYVRGQKCDMERIRAIACDEQFEIPPDLTRSYCWENNPKMPAEYTLLQEHSETVYTQPQTLRTLAFDVADSMLSQLTDSQFRLDIGLDSADAAAPTATAPHVLL